MPVHRAAAAMLIVLAVVAACGRKPAGQDPVSGQAAAAILRPVQDLEKALGAGDIDRAMREIHPDCPTRAETERMLREILPKAQLTYKTEELEVVESGAGQAKVLFVQTVKKAGGDLEFRDYRVSGVHTLRTSDGGWKIYETGVKKITYLDR